MVVSARHDLVIEHVGRESVVWEPSNGSLHLLNATATLVLEAVQLAPVELEELVRDLADAFGQPVELIGGQVYAVVEAMLASELVVAAAQPGT